MSTLATIDELPAAYRQGLERRRISWRSGR